MKTCSISLILLFISILDVQSEHVCPEGTWGDNCALQCTCGANTETCNPETGACSCKTGWQGTTCNIDIDECADASVQCPDNSGCQNTAGSYICQCNIGYSKSSGGSCQDTDECASDLLHSCPENAACQNTDGSFLCQCNIGFSVTTDGNCQVCPQGTWGDNCALQCTCGANTETCNPETGACSCKSGWQGDACNIDIDECADASVHQCPENSECQNTDGSYICQCNIGYSKASDRSCQESSQTADEDFQTVNAESSNTYQQQCSALRKNGYVVIKGRPCKIDSVSMLEHRKHGHAKVRIVGLDIFTGEKFKDVCQPTHEMDVPIISLTDFQLINVSEDSRTTLKDDKGATRDDVKLPEGDLGKEVTKRFKNGEQLTLTVLEAMGEAKISAVKATA